MVTSKNKMVNIIGAGPAGSYTAYLLAKANKQVTVYEEHKTIGSPIQCTGIVTSKINKVLDFKLNKNIIINKINKVKIFAPNKKFIQLKLKNKNLILDRKKFDQLIAEKAKQHGAKFILNHKFIKRKNNDILIGADGPLSTVAKISNLYKKRKFMTGFQIRVKLENNNEVEFYPYIGCFAWIVPENDNIVRLGVAAYNNTKKYFDYLKKIKQIRNINILEKQGGLIPIYDPKLKTQKNNTYLIGDAATQLKATTGGGIIQSLIASKALSKSIIKHKNYEKEWKKYLAKELYLHLKLRNIMDKFNKKDWNKLINIFNKKHNRQLLENFDRDNLSKHILKIALTNPELVYFIKYLF